MTVSVKLVFGTKGAANHGIIHQDSLGGLPSTSLSDAPRHRCIIEPGNPTGGRASCQNEKDRGRARPRPSTKRELSPAKGTWRTKRWRTAVSNAGKGVAKVNGSVRDILRRRTFPPDFLTFVPFRFFIAQAIFFLKSHYQSLDVCVRLRVIYDRWSKE